MRYVAILTLLTLGTYSLDAQADIFGPTGSVPDRGRNVLRQEVRFQNSPNDGSWGQSVHAGKSLETAGASLPSYVRTHLDKAPLQTPTVSTPTYTAPLFSEDPIRDPSYVVPRESAPVNIKPVIERPRFEKPKLSGKPSYEAPGYSDHPSYKAPRVQAPAMNRPGFDQSGIETHKPSYQQPTLRTEEYHQPRTVTPEYPTISW